MHPLDGPLLKVRRAISEVERLIRAEETFGRDAGYHVVRAEFNHKTGKYVRRVRKDREPDPEWGIYVGEIAHNLRSALDGLVHQLVLLNCKTPTDTDQFPIYLIGHTKRKHRRRNKLITIPHFWGMELADGLSQIRKIKTKHQAMIERLQPYKRRGAAAIEVGVGRNHVLHLLRELNNADKHRLLQVIGAKSAPNVYINPKFGRVVFDAIGPGHVVLKDGAKFDETTPGVQVDSKITPLIAFADGCEAVKNKGVTFTLFRMARHVEFVIHQFVQEF